MASKFEYHVEAHSKKNPLSKEVINGLGSEGWELCAVVPVGRNVNVWYFKRLKEGYGHVEVSVGNKPAHQSLDTYWYSGFNPGYMAYDFSDYAPVKAKLVKKDVPNSDPNP